MNLLTLAGLIEFSMPVVLYLVFKGRKRWLKYVMVITLLVTLSQLFCILNHNVILIMILLILSSRYFSKGFTAIIAVLSIILLSAASVLTIVYGIIDLNFYPSPAEGTVITIHDKLRPSVLSLGVDTSKAITSMVVNYLMKLTFTVGFFILQITHFLFLLLN